MSEYMIFCFEEYQRNHYAFNKPVSNKRYQEILDYCKEVLKYLELKFDKNSWEDEWKNVSNAQWKKLAKLPEWDKEVVEKIIGFELNLEDDLLGEEVEVKVEGRKYKAKIIN